MGKRERRREWGKEGKKDKGRRKTETQEKERHTDPAVWSSGHHRELEAARPTNGRGFYQHSGFFFFFYFAMRTKMKRAVIYLVCYLPSFYHLEKRNREIKTEITLLSWGCSDKSGGTGLQFFLLWLVVFSHLHARCACWGDAKVFKTLHLSLRILHSCGEIIIT